MQIFMLSDCPRQSASLLYFMDRRRAVNQIKETMQALSDLVGNPPSGYRKFNPNHPIVKWLGETEGNTLWAMDNLDALNDLYYNETGKNHKSYDRFMQFIPELNEYLDSTSFVQRGVTSIDLTAFNPKLSQYKDLPIPRAYTKYLWTKLQEEAS